MVLKAERSMRNTLSGTILSAYSLFFAVGIPFLFVGCNSIPQSSWREISRQNRETLDVFLIDTHRTTLVGVRNPAQIFLATNLEIRIETRDSIESVLFSGYPTSGEPHLISAFENVNAKEFSFMTSAFLCREHAGSH